MPKINVFTDEENKAIEKEYRSIIRILKPRLISGEEKRIRLAFEMANDAHMGMRRKSGEPYIFHPIAVARICAEEIGLGATAVICGFLHDTVEDTEITLADIENSFDKNISKIIAGLTKISVEFDVNSSEQAENFRKLILTLTDDIRVILVKLADRLHNMRTMSEMPRHKQLRTASETSFLYAPIAHRMGLNIVKTELEDLALKYLEPEMYQFIKAKLNETKRSRTKYINNFIRPIKMVLDALELDYEIYGRPKSIHSIWNKMKNKQVSFEEVYDLFAIRIILNSSLLKEKSDCWTVYSIITDSYKPNPNRLRDWISNPKSNGYEALHTTVMGPGGRYVEVQIRSKRMHEVAEKGVAAHWKYKGEDDDSPQEKENIGLDNWLKSVHSLLENADQNSLEMVNDFKMDLFNDEIFVFTPKGDLKRLNQGATILDFAYEIHSAIGNQCMGAKVNHKLVPLSFVLNTGDQIEILTSKKQKPSEDWLKFVVTSKAKSAIKKAVKESYRQIAEEGKVILDRKLKSLKVNHSEENLWTLATFFKVDSPLDVYHLIASDKSLVLRLKELDINAGIFTLEKSKDFKKQDFKEYREYKPIPKNAELILMGEDANFMEYSFATCCNPIPGDDVFGFISIGEGIKVHRTNCPNAVNMMSKYSYRIVKARWNTGTNKSFLTGIVLEGIDNVGVVSQVSAIITKNLEINMQSIAFVSKDGIYEGKINLYVTNQEELQLLMNELKALEGVVSVRRFEINELDAM
jgi:guanosine-3',5'-bis(diphosphate) 3'-pyrophosphohydrolase